MPKAPDCPCTSGARYGACCAPYHRGTAEAPTAERLMRSRYAAFALREAGYLWRTLHPEHPDRGRPEADVVRELKETARVQRFPGLQVLEAREAEPGGTGEVLFLARVFEKGFDASFVERSRFRHDGTGWRYLDGVGRSVLELGGHERARTLTLDTFPPPRP